MKLQKTIELINVELLSKIIFINFLYLENEKNISFTQKSILDTLNSSSLISWFLLDDNNNTIGYLIGSIQRINDGRLVYYISYFYIIEEYQNKGYGNSMMLECIKEIKNQNIKFIMLISKKNSPAESLYRRMGFIPDPIMKLDNNNFEILYLFN